MKKCFKAIGIVGMLLSMSLLGCSKGNLSNNKNSTYTSAQKEFEFIIDAIERKDNAAIKDKFSTYSTSKINDIDGKINRLINEFPGYVGDVTIKDTFERHGNHGKITCAYTPSFDFTVDDATYRMRIIYYTEADEDPDKLGWYSIQLYKRHDPNNSSSMYTHGVKDDPDILLWDYTKDR